MFPATSPLATLLAKHHVKVKFVLVGVWNTAFGYLVFVALDMLFARTFARRYIAYMTAMVLSNVVAIMNAYVFHKYVTFRSDVSGKNIYAEFLRFSTTYLFTFALALMLMPLFVEICGLVPRIAAALVLFVCTVISYIGHSKFSFRRGDHTRPRLTRPDSHEGRPREIDDR